jgi:hypothetical protein
MAYRVYTAELRQFGAPAIIIVAGWQTPDEILHAEWFAIQGTQLASEPISSDKRNHPDLPLESEDDMMAEALRRAREHLQGKRDMLPEHVRSTQEKERQRHPLFLVQAWLRGRATALKEVASKTGCAELRAQLGRIIRLPIIVSPDEAFYFFK